jgi:predicted transcriptional regulator
MNNKPNPNSHRQRCLAALDEGPLTTHEVCKIVGSTPTKVSRELSKLADAGQVNRMGKEGRFIFWSTES